MELMEENKDVGRVFMMTRRQYITVGMGQPVDINIASVGVVMGIYKVRDKERCLERVRRLFFETLPRNNG